MATIEGETDSPAIRWTLWTFCVVAWTLVLTTSKPAHVLHDVLEHDTVRFSVAKTAHVLGYTFLTILSAWLRVRGDRRWLLLVFLSEHGVATECIQTVVPGRSGSPLDVGLDHIGIVLGLALSWKWWRN